MIRYNVWSWWEFNNYYNSNKHNKIFLEVKDFSYLSTDKNIIPVINCFASDRFKGKTISIAKSIIKKDILNYSYFYNSGMIKGIVFDYIRQGGYSDLKPSRKDIREIIDFAKKYFNQNDIYVAVMMNWKSWLHGQYWSDFKGVIKMPMIYGKGFLTHFFLYFYGLFYSNIIPCIRAWDTTKEEFKKQEKILNDLGVPFSVWKIQDLKELLKR